MTYKVYCRGNPVFPERVSVLTIQANSDRGAVLKFYRCVVSLKEILEIQKCVRGVWKSVCITKKLLRT